MTEAIAAVNDFAFLTLGLDHFYVCNAGRSRFPPSGRFA